MTTKRNITVDILKGCGIITVIIIHVFRGEGIIETFIGEIGRWAVPAFFMIQGFYLHLTAQKSWWEMAFKNKKDLSPVYPLFNCIWNLFLFL